jgi:aspartyl-tRNA(Asn)/glutamyl-tRNA(Gln) amidotransferase subunit B
MATSGKAPRQIVEAKGLVQISDSTAIEEIVSKVIANCSAEVAAYKKGKTKLLGFFVGQVMQATHGKANPKLVNAILKKKLAG